MKVLYNDVRQNFESDKPIVQGGTSRFIRSFREYMDDIDGIELIPVFSIERDSVKDPYTEDGTNSVGLIYHSIVFSGQLFYSLFKEGKINREETISRLQGVIDQMVNIMSSTKPDLVFINGFGIFHWIILYAAHSLDIPTVIRHGGIWERELRLSKEIMSRDIRKVFGGFERDTVLWCAHHIFLNQSSRGCFEKMHNSREIHNIIENQSTVVPQLVLTEKYSDFDKNLVGDKIEIGMVARWDKIKNHEAVLRLAKTKYGRESLNINVVTTLPRGGRSRFVKQYDKLVNVVKPIPFDEVRYFYEKMDLVLLLSIFDVAPNVVPESYMSGTPVLITDGVGWVDLYRRCGLEDHIVRPNISGRSLAKKIKNIADNRDRYISRYCKVIEEFKTHHNANSVFDKYLAIIRGNYR